MINSMDCQNRHDCPANPAGRDFANLANVSTNGFKRNNAVFEDLIYQNLRQVGAQTTKQNQLPTGLHLGLACAPLPAAPSRKAACSSPTTAWMWRSTAMAF